MGEAVPIDSAPAASQEDSTELPVQQAPSADGVVSVVLNCPNGAVVRTRISRGERLVELRSALAERPETCFLTCIQFVIGGHSVNEYELVDDVDGLDDGATIVVTSDAYTLQSLHAHLIRLQEILFSRVEFHSPCTVMLDEAAQVPLSNDNHRAILEESHSLESFAMGWKHDVSPALSIIDVRLSGYNPPLPFRIAQGDIAYLEVEDVDGNLVFVTACDRGFFVNRSTRSAFSPEPEKPAASPCVTLAQLLRSHSARWKREITSCVQFRCALDPAETAAPALLAQQWMGADAATQLQRLRYRPSAATDAMLNEPLLRGVQRDPNEEIQLAREIPASTAEEALAREQRVLRAQADFLQSARDGARMVVEGQITPFNPNDAHKCHMFVHDNVFFTFAADPADPYRTLDEDNIATRASSNLDARSVHVFSQYGPSGICTVSSAIVDYAGHRVVAQAVIPGIFQGSQSERMLYGRLERDDALTCDQEVHEAMMQASAALHVKPVAMEHGKEFVGSSELKITRATDDRKYALDIMQLTPRDITRGTSENEELAVLRWELVHNYVIQKARQAYVDEINAWKRTTGQSGSGEAADAETSTEEPAVPADVRAKAEERIRETEEKLRVNIHAFTTNDHLASDEDRALVKELCAYQQDAVIGGLRAEAKAWLSAAVEGSWITRELHRRGVNMRYLGKVAHVFDGSPAVHAAIVMEMIARALKRTVNAILRECASSDRAALLATLFNTLLGKNALQSNIFSESWEKASGLALADADAGAQGEDGAATAQFGVPAGAAAPRRRKGGRKGGARGHSGGGRVRKHNARVSLNFGSRDQCWNRVRQHVWKHFSFRLGDLSAYGLSPLALLRAACCKTGVQLAARAYDFRTDAPLVPSDIAGLLPRVKVPEFTSHVARSILHAAQTAAAQGEPVAAPLAHEASLAFQTTLGLLHKDTGAALELLAQTLARAGEVTAAIQHYRRAIIVYERTLGMDHPQTAFAYTRLATLSRQHQRLEEARALLSHAVRALSLSLGVRHPERMSALVQLALLHVDLGDAQDGLRIVHGAVEQCTAVFGRDSPRTGSLYEAMGSLSMRMGLGKLAAKHIQTAKSIYNTCFGPEHAKVTECTRFLDALDRAQTAGKPPSQ